MKRHHVQKLVKLVGEEMVGQNRLQRSFYAQNSLDLAKSLLGKVLVRCLPTGHLLRGTIVETEAYPGSEEAKDLGVHCFITKQTDKNAGIFMEPGTTWVYMTYGVFNMINVSALGAGSACLVRAVEPKDEPLDLEVMEQFRLEKKAKKMKTAPSSLDTAVATESGRTTRSESRTSSAKQLLSKESAALINLNEPVQEDTPDPADSIVQTKSKFKLHQLCNGPGKLCKALNIEKSTCDQLDLTTSCLLWIEDNDDPKYETETLEVVEATRIGISSAPQSSQTDLLRFYIADNFCVSTAKPSQIKKKLAGAEER